MISACSFPDCGRPVWLRTYCKAHHYQILAGTQLRPLRFRRKNGSLPQIIYEEVACPVVGLKGKCRIFSGKTNGNGYGFVWANGRHVYVHRFVWEQVNGSIPDGLVVDYQCRVRRCCNVDHLRVVTTRVNLLENSIGPSALNAKKTHCQKGHEYNADNTRHRSSGGRVCAVCESVRKWRKIAFREGFIFDANSAASKIVAILEAVDPAKWTGIKEEVVK